MIGEPAEDIERGPRHAALCGRRAQAPLPHTQWLGDQAAVEPGRGEVVVVGEGQVNRVVGKQAERLIWFVLTDAEQHGGMPLRQEPDNWQHGFAHGGSERRHPYRAGVAVGSRSSRAASMAARIVTACPASRCPAGVSRTRRPCGSVSGVPAS